jgi:hypothetical protein
MKRTMNKLVVVLVAIEMCGVSAAQSPSGWRRLIDPANPPKPLCQGMAPQGWGSSHLEGNIAKGIARVGDYSLQGKNFTFVGVKSLAPTPFQVLEDSPTRYWIAYQGKDGYIPDYERSYRYHWYVVVPAKGTVCVMEVFFNDPALTQEAKSIALSLKGTTS